MTKQPLRNENAYNLDIINRHKNIVVLLDGTILTDATSLRDFSRGLGVLPIMAYAGRLRPEGVPFSGTAEGSNLRPEGPKKFFGEGGGGGDRGGF